ncbi:hypothetical protein TNCV_129841 [Trichonephila clavipes]|nr:hypothetical protein TNCV_129841 [Trichonephila clavipes]
MLLLLNSLVSCVRPPSFYGRTVTVVSFGDDALEPFFCLFKDAVGHDFILVGDYTSPHGAHLNHPKPVKNVAERGGPIATEAHKLFYLQYTITIKACTSVRGDHT